MLRIRLRRTGNKNNPFYRVVVSDRRKTPLAAFVDDVGYYNPQAFPAKFELDLNSVDQWISKGAVPSTTVHKIILAARAGDTTFGSSTAAKAKAEAVSETDAQPESEAPIEEKTPDTSDTEDTTQAESETPIEDKTPETPDTTEAPSEPAIEAAPDETPSGDAPEEKAEEPKDKES